MIELIIGLLSTLVPVLLDLFSDKIIDGSNNKKLEKIENEIKTLYNAEDEIDIAIAWTNHDDQLQLLLQESEAERQA